MTKQEYESWEQLREIAGMLPGVSYGQLTNWESRRPSNGFPEPTQVQGRYKFYDPAEIKKWVFLHRKATKNWRGQGERLNGKG